MSEQHRLATKAWAKRMRADPTLRARERKRDRLNRLAREYAAQRVQRLEAYLMANLQLQPCPTCGGDRFTCGHYCLYCGGPFGIGNRGQTLSTCGSPLCVNKAKIAGRKQTITREQSVDPAIFEKRNDPRACRCGAKLVWLVDMWGQVSERCDRCGHHADFGRHPIKDAA